MASPFDNLAIAQIKRALSKAKGCDYEVNARFYGGDHWQEGCGWVGPKPPHADPGFAQVMCEIKTAFVSSNKVKEIVRRHIGGCIGREPSFGLTVRRPLGKVPKTRPAAETPATADQREQIGTRDPAAPSTELVDEKPNEAEQNVIDEAEALLTEWWDERGIHTLFQEVVATLLLGERATLRLFVPPARLVDGQIPQADLRTALFALYAHQPDYGQAIVITDKATQAKCSAYVYTEAHVTYAELSYLDDDGKTVLRIISNASDVADAFAEPLDLGGQLMLHELKRPLLVTEQIRANQKQLNLSKTMMGRNVVQGGFLERIILNGQMPGQWVDDASAEGGKRFVPSAFRVGAGTTNFIAGATYTDEDGKTHVANPSVVYRDPVKVDTFEQTERGAYRSILEEAQQLHALISGDATASGESRKQARGDYQDDLGLTETPINRAGRWLLETALSLAAIFAGQPGRYAGLRATFEARINTGALSSDEIAQIQSLSGGKQLLSQETGMSRIGVEDVDAEKAKIAEESAAAIAAMPPALTDPTKDPEANPTKAPADDPAKTPGDLPVKE